MRSMMVVKRLFAGSVRGVGRGWERWGPALDVPSADRRWRHWAHSLAAIHDARAMARLDVPWWTYRAVAETERWLRRRPVPARVFEYGSGASTIWLARRAGQVMSVEHDAGFARHMETVLREHPNASVRVVEPSRQPHPVVASGKSGHGGLDFTSYVRAIDDVAGDFDLIVIDGRARAACLEVAVDRLAHDGLIVFDNSRRRRYRRAITRSGLDERILRGLTPSLPYPEQTSLLSRR
jgi:predicted O-methyltransferase YrrM